MSTIDALRMSYIETEAEKLNRCLVAIERILHDYAAHDIPIGNVISDMNVTAREARKHADNIHNMTKLVLRLSA